jgi:hypothetical protein
MPGPLRLLVAPALLVALVAVLLCLAPHALRPLGLDLEDLQAQYRRLHQSRRQGEELDRRREAVLRSIAVKEGVVAQLIAGRLTLPQAAARFRDLKAESPDDDAPPGPACDRGEGERLCRQVMGWADSWLADHAPERAGAVAARLEAELRRLRDRTGTVRLPD